MCYFSEFETIQPGKKEWFIELLSFNKKYLKLFNCVQIKLIVVDNKTWDHLAECTKMSSG